MKIYLDTSIYLDYWQNRADKMRPLGEFAFSLMKEAIKCRFLILISNEVLKELEKVTGFSEEKVWNTILSSLKEANKIAIVKINLNQIKESEKIAKQKNIPKADALHAVLSRDNDAILISRDYHHDSVREIAEVMKPEEILVA